VQPFEQVLVEHGPTVLRVCLALLPRSEAEDAWSETFLAALRAYPELPPGANVQAWLVTIAHRKTIDALRARARRPVPTAEDRLGRLVADTAAEAGSTDQVDRHEPELARAVRELPPRQRAAVAYHYLADLSYREVAVLVGTTPDAARRAAADGIASLRRHPSLHPDPTGAA